MLYSAWITACARPDCCVPGNIQMYYACRMLNDFISTNFYISLWNE